MLLAGCDAIQLIDADSNFNQGVQVDNADEIGIRYNVVSIIGAQSGGKSTLFNTMCGTTFQTMDSDLATIHQTTRGVWLSEDWNAPLLILDIEGTDSSERNKEGERAFERRSGVFALAVSDTVLINVNYQDINREHGSGLPLFEELQRAYLKLFHNKITLKAKPRIIVVLRDYLGRPAPNNVKAQIYEKLQERWEAVARSCQMEGLKLTDVFDVGVQLMSHYVLAPDQFRAECVILRNQILAQGPLVSARNLSLGSFIPFASNAWRIIHQDPSLDVPAQAALLCLYRIDQAQAVASSRIKSKSCVELFGHQEAMTILDDALDAFEKSCYGLEDFESQLETYVESLFAKLRDPAEAYILECGTTIIKDFIQDAAGNIKPRSIEEYRRRFESDVRHTTFEVCHLFESRNYSYVKEFRIDSEKELRRAERVLQRNQALAQGSPDAATFASNASRIILQHPSVDVPQFLCLYRIDQAQAEASSRIKNKSCVELFGHQEAMTILDDALDAFEKSCYGLEDFESQLETYVESLFAKLRDPGEAYILECGRTIIKGCMQNPAGNMEPRSIEEYIRRFESDVSHTTLEVCHLFESRNYSYVKEFRIDYEEKLQRFRDLVLVIHERERRHRDRLQKLEQELKRRGGCLLLVRFFLVRHSL